MSTNPMAGFGTLALAQLRAVFRDRATLFWMLLFPLLFLGIFGLINSGDGETKKSELVQVGAVPLFDEMPAEGKAQFSQLFDVSHSDDRAAALEQLRKGDADVVIEGTRTQLVVHYSNADATKAAVVTGTLGSFVDAANLAMTHQKPTFSMTSEAVEDASLKPIQYLTPGLLGYAIAMGGVFGGALTLVNWRKTRLLRRIRLTPVGAAPLVLSRVVASLAISTMQFVAFVGLGVALFGLKLTGWWWLGLPLVLIGMLPFMAIGLVAGAISKTEEAASGLANLIVLPMSFLGGAFLPLEFAPGWLQKVANLLPMGHLVQGLMDVMARGQGPAALLQPVAILLGFTLAFVLLAARLFRWED